MTLRVGETGKTWYVSSDGFDLSSFTELTLTFIKPGGTEVTKTQTAGEVALGGVNVTVTGLGALLANKYVTYEVESGLLDTAGAWKVYLTYTNTATTPDDVFIGSCASETILAVCG